jgi:hypothetical protein
MTDPEYRFGAVAMDPAETLQVTLNLFRICASFWRGNEPYASSEYVRPNRATGFAYECTTAGTSAGREPVWPRVISSTVTDGSAVWTCRAAEANAISAVSSPSAASDPTGLTIGSVSVSESAKILATYSGGTLGQDYDAVFTFTLNGATRVARQRVQVRKR